MLALHKYVDETCCFKQALRRRELSDMDPTESAETNEDYDSDDVKLVRKANLGIDAFLLQEGRLAISPSIYAFTVN